MEVVSDELYKISYLNDFLTVLSNARFKPYLANHTGTGYPSTPKSLWNFWSKTTNGSSSASPNNKSSVLGETR